MSVLKLAHQLSESQPLLADDGVGVPTADDYAELQQVTAPATLKWLTTTLMFSDQRRLRVPVARSGSAAFDIVDAVATAELSQFDF